MLRTRGRQRVRVVMSNSKSTPWPQLSRLRQQAKSLLKSIHQKDSEALERFLNARHPDFLSVFVSPDHFNSTGSDWIHQVRLHHVQWVLSRELGLKSWPNLKAYCETLEMAQAERVQGFIRYAVIDHRFPEQCNFTKAKWMLEADPALRGSDLCVALVSGESEPILKKLKTDENWVHQKTGPKNWEPILYLAYSFFLSRSESRVDSFSVMLQAMLEAGADPNAWYDLKSDPDPNARQTVLYGLAGLAQRHDLTELLLEAGADPNDAAPGLGPESLYHAAESSDLRCLEALLKAGPDPDKVSYCLLRKLDFEDPEGVQLFLRYGADPNFSPPHFHGAASLIAAIRNGRSKEVLEKLIQGGANPMQADFSGMTPIRLAMRYGYSELVNWLRERIEFEIPDTAFDNEDRFWGAVFSGDRLQAEKFFRSAQIQFSGMRPESASMFSRAAFLGNHEAVKILMDLGFPLSLVDREGMTPLHWAVWNADLDLTQTLLHASESPLEQRSNYDGTILGTAVYAAFHGPGNRKSYPTIIRWLLEAGSVAAGRCAYPTPDLEINAILKTYLDPKSVQRSLHPHVEMMMTVANSIQSSLKQSQPSQSAPALLRDVMNQWLETFRRDWANGSEWTKLVWSNSSVSKSKSFEGTTKEEALKQAGVSDFQNVVAEYFGWKDWRQAELDPAWLNPLNELFEQAVDLILEGKADQLSEMIRRYPELIDQSASWGHRCQFIHYIAANGIEMHRQVTPPNAVEIARILLEAGADPDALANTYGGGPNQTPLCLVITSAHPGERKLRTALVETLIEYGASPVGIDDNNAPLRLALQYGETGSAEILHQAGARPWNLWSAAGVGTLTVAELEESKPTSEELAEALYFAGRHGRLEAVRVLLDHGADMYFPGFFGGTAAHWACIEGHESVVKLLVQRGMNPEIRDPTFDATLAGWAAEGGHSQLKQWLDVQSKK